jgi:hypothetical protein
MGGFGDSPSPLPSCFPSFLWKDLVIDQVLYLLVSLIFYGRTWWLTKSSTFLFPLFSMGGLGDSPSPFSSCFTSFLWKDLVIDQVLHLLVSLIFYGRSWWLTKSSTFLFPLFSMGGLANSPSLLSSCCPCLLWKDLVIDQVISLLISFVFYGRTWWFTKSSPFLFWIFFMEGLGY